jgi:hypothetical protein
MKVKVEEMNRNAAEEYYDLIEEIAEELVTDENPAELLNMDKTRLPMNNCPGRIVAQGGTKYRKVTKVTSVEHGENITLVAC